MHHSDLKTIHDYIEENLLNEDKSTWGFTLSFKFRLTSAKAHEIADNYVTKQQRLEALLLKQHFDSVLSKQN